MNRETFEELATGYAIGALSEAETAQFEAMLAEDPSLRAEVASFIDTAAALAQAGSYPVTPRAELKDRILAGIAAAGENPEAASQPPTPPGFSFILNDGTGWMPGDSPGFEFKVLSGGPGHTSTTLLGRLAPGAKFPEHDHEGTEQLFVVSGHLHTEGRRLGPGDFLRAEPGTHHHELVSPEGCIALLIMEMAPG